MADYRLYALNPDGGIEEVEEFTASDDAEAIRVSRRGLRRRPAELWCRSRIVETLHPAKAPNARSAPGRSPERSSRKR